MIIRRLEESDIPGLVKLYQELLPIENRINVTEETFKRIKHNSDYRVIVAIRDNEVIGTALGVYCDLLSSNGKGMLIIEDVIITKEERGKGIGKKLIIELEKFAIEKNCIYIMLVSTGERKSAHTFYEKIGYLDDVRGFRKYL